jgi:hypothetical protein
MYGFWVFVVASLMPAACILIYALCKTSGDCSRWEERQIFTSDGAEPGYCGEELFDGFAKLYNPATGDLKILPPVRKNTVDGICQLPSLGLQWQTETISSSKKYNKRLRRQYIPRYIRKYNV